VLIQLIIATNQRHGLELHLVWEVEPVIIASHYVRKLIQSLGSPVMGIIRAACPGILKQKGIKKKKDWHIQHSLGFEPSHSSNTLHIGYYKFGAAIDTGSMRLAGGGGWNLSKNK
jgi:hypothetical protein